MAKNNETPNAEAETTKEITIQGVSVTVSAPYAADHVCTEAEAKALNQVRAENIRNNTAKAVKDLKETHGEDGDALQAAVDEAVAKYDAEYEFTLASVGGGNRARLDPVDKEAQTIARNYISGALKEQNMTQKAYIEANGEDSIKNKIAELAQNPKVIEMAKGVVAERAKNQNLAEQLKL